MNSKAIVTVALAAACVLSLGAEAFAAGNKAQMGGQGTGKGIRLRDGSCLTSTTTSTSSTSSTSATQTRQQLKSATGTTSGVGQMRRLGPGDGTGNTVPPMDGTGYGFPNTAPTN